MTQQQAGAAVAVANNGGALAPQEIRQLSATEVISRINEVKSIMANAMIPGTHYGVIPGCGDKPSLFKPGAEMLAMTFRISPEVDFKINDLGNGHREYTVTCALRHIGTGIVWAYGVGSCATTESKYKYRYEWQNKQKVRVENKDIADVYNTCLKMAKKRAQIDATLTALSCSHLFTQDLEDYKEDFSEHKKPVEPLKAECEVVNAKPPKSNNPGEYAVNINGDTPPDMLNEAEKEKLRSWLKSFSAQIQHELVRYCRELKINFDNSVSKRQAAEVERYALDLLELEKANAASAGGSNDDF
jgi:hypothetical protein